MPGFRLAAACVAATLALLAGCATAPSHPALQQAEAAGTLPPLVPVRRFVADVDYAGGFNLSPDGRSLLWSKVVGVDSGLAVRPVDGGDERSFATGYLARFYTWLPDSRHVAYLKDLRGDENTHIHVFDSRAPFEPWAVTPWPGVRSYYVAGGEPGTARFFFASNRRDRSTFDLYEADVATRSVREVARSNGLVLGWIIGSNHRLAARVRQTQSTDGADVAIEVPQGEDGWRTVRVVSAWDSVYLHRVDPVAGKAWGLSNVGRDKTALMEMDLRSGAETVLAQDPDVDLSYIYYRGREGGPPIAYLTDAGRPAIRYLDAPLGREFEQAMAKATSSGLVDAPRFFRPQSLSLDASRWVLRALGDFDDAELLFDRATGAVTRLDPPQPERKALLQAQQPFRFQASDGRTIHGYIIRPRGVQGPAPLVVNIHGGPWARDTWNPAGYDYYQFLANRGYAVLTVNYRGSSGYGRDHMMAGKQVYYTRLQQDIAEAAQWAVDQGIADPKRMAAVGASFGGFSALSQLVQQRHDWRCGVDIVGVANWARVIENWPPYWRGFAHLTNDFFGDVKKPEDRARMLENSPITYIDRIKVPLLVIQGANDVRVVRQDSDEVVAKLRELGRPVDYLVFPDEGHSIRRWRNRMETWRRIEDHLASCLGGRSAGWDFYQLIPR